MQTFADRLRILRNKEKISQRDLGDRLGVSQQAVAKWENGTSTPDPDMLAKISMVFQVSADYLVGLSDNIQIKNLTSAEREALKTATADLETFEATDEELAAALPSNIRQGILALLRIERDKQNNN